MRTLVQDFLFLTSGRTFVQISKFLIFLLLLKYADLEFNGFWSTYLVVVAFATTSHLGILNGYMIKASAFYIKNAGKSRFCQLCQTTQLTIISSAVFSGVVFFFLHSLFLNHPVLAGLSAILLITQYFVFYIEIELSVRNQYRRLNGWFFISALLHFTGGWVGLYYGRAIGFLISQIISDLVSLGLTGDLWLGLSCFRLRLMGWLLKTGFPVTLSGWLQSLLLATDRLIIGLFLPPEQAGYYFVPVVFTSLFILFPRNLQRINITSAQPLKIAGINRLINRQLLWYLPLVFLFMVLCFFGIPPLLARFLPQYRPAVPAFQILLPGLFFLGMREILVSKYFLSRNRHWVTGFDALSVIINLILNLVAYRLGWGITGIAGSSSISYLINFICLYFWIPAIVKKP